MSKLQKNGKKKGITEQQEIFQLKSVSHRFFLLPFIPHWLFFLCDKGNGIYKEILGQPNCLLL